MEIGASVEPLTKYVNAYCYRAENESDKSLFTKANDIRESISSKEELMKKVDLTMKKLEEEKKMSK